MTPSDVLPPCHQEDIHTTLYNLIISQLKYDYHQAAATSIELSRNLSPLPAANDLHLIITAWHNSALLFEQAQNSFNTAAVIPPLSPVKIANSHLEFVDSKPFPGLPSVDLSPLRPPRTLSVLSTVPPLYFPPQVPPPAPPLITKYSFKHPLELIEETESSTANEDPVLYCSKMSKLANELLDAKTAVSSDELASTAAVNVNKDLIKQPVLHCSELSKLTKQFLKVKEYVCSEVVQDVEEEPVDRTGQCDSEILKEFLNSANAEKIKQPVLFVSEVPEIAKELLDVSETEKVKKVKERPSEPLVLHDNEMSESRSELLNDAAQPSALIDNLIYSHELELELKEPLDNQTLPKKSKKKSKSKIQSQKSQKNPSKKLKRTFSKSAFKSTSTPKPAVIIHFDDIKVDELCLDYGEEEDSQSQTPDDWFEKPDEVSDCPTREKMPSEQEGSELILDYHGNVISPVLPEEIIKNVPQFSDHEKNVIVAFLQSQVNCSCEQFQARVGQWIPKLLLHTVSEILQALLGASSVDDILAFLDTSDVDDDFTDSIEHYTKPDKDGNLVNMLRIRSDHCGLFYRKKALNLDSAQKEEIVSILAEKWRTRLDFWTEIMLQIDMSTHIYNVNEILFATFGKDYKDYVGRKEGVGLIRLKLTQEENQKVVSVLSEGWMSKRSAHTKISEQIPMVSRCSLDEVLFGVFKETTNDNVEIKRDEFGVELLKLKGRSNAVRQVGSLILNDHEKNIIVARLSTMFYFYSEIPDRFCKQLPKLVHFSTDEVLQAIFGERFSEFIEEHPTKRTRSIRLDRTSDYNSALNKPPLILNKPQKHSIVDCLSSEWLPTKAFIFNYEKLNGRRIRNLNYYTMDEILFAVFGKNVNKCMEEMVTDNGNLAIRIKDMEEESGAESDSSSIVFEDLYEEAGKSTKTVYSFITYEDYIRPPKQNHPDSSSDTSDGSDAEEELIACDDVMMEPLEVLELSRLEKQIVVSFLQTKLRGVCSTKIFKRVITERIPRVIFYSVDEILSAIFGEYDNNEVQRFTINNFIDSTKNKMLKARSVEDLFHNSKEDLAAVEIDGIKKESISKLLSNNWITAASFKAKVIKLAPLLSNCSVDEILFVIFGESSDKVIRETVTAKGEIVMSISLQFTAEEQRIVVSFLCEGWKKCDYVMSYFDKHIPKVRDCTLDEVLFAAFGSEVNQNVETDFKDGLTSIRLKKKSEALKDIGIIQLSNFEKTEITARLSTRFYEGKAFCEGFASRFTKVQHLTIDQLLHAIFGEQVLKFVEKHPTKPDWIRLKRGSDYNRLLNKRELVLSSSEVIAVKDALTWRSWVVCSNFHSMVIQKVNKLKAYTADEILTAVFGTNLTNLIEEKVNDSGEVAFKLKRHSKVSDTSPRPALQLSVDERSEVERLLANWTSETNLIKSIEQLIPHPVGYDIDEILGAAFGENLSEFINQKMANRSILLRLKLRLNEDEKQYICSLFNTPGGFISKAEFVSNNVRKKIPKITKSYSPNEVLRAVFEEELDQVLETLIGMNGRQEFVRLKGVPDLVFNEGELQAIYIVLSAGWIPLKQARKEIEKIPTIERGLDINTILLTVFKDRLSYYVGRKVQDNSKVYLRLQHFEFDDDEACPSYSEASCSKPGSSTDTTLTVSRMKERYCVSGVEDRLAIQALLEPFGKPKGGLILNLKECEDVRSVLNLGKCSHMSENIYMKIKKKIPRTEGYCLDEILTAALGDVSDRFVKSIVDIEGKSMRMFNPDPDLKLDENEVRLVYSCLSTLGCKKGSTLRKEIIAKIPKIKGFCLEVVLFAAFGDRLPYYIDTKCVINKIEYRLKKGVDCDQVLRYLNLYKAAEVLAKSPSEEVFAGCPSDPSEEFEEQVNMAGPSQTGFSTDNYLPQETEGLLTDHEKNVIVAKLSARFYVTKAFLSSFHDVFPQLKDLTSDTILFEIFGDRISEFVATNYTRITLNRNSDYNSVLKKAPLILNEEEKELVKALLGTKHIMMYTFLAQIQTRDRFVEYTGEEILFATFGDKVKTCITETVSAGGNIGVRFNWLMLAVN